MTQKTIHIVRHGQTDFNKHKIVQGSGVNSSLNETGRKQANAFFQKYQNIGFEVVLTSKLVRTHETMAPFIQQGLSWEQFGEIDEMSWGAHEGKQSNPAMIEEYRWMIEQWKSGNYQVGISGGETALDLAKRIQTFVDHLKQRPEEKILVCSHGRAMRCLMALLRQEELLHMEQYHHSNTGLYLVDYQPDEFTFQLKNDTSHFLLDPSLTN